MPITWKHCSYCNEMFPASRIDAEYCGEAHRQAAATKRKRSGTTKPAKEPATKRRDLPPAPDALWPSDNDMEIPQLDIAYCADAIQLPIAKWGTISRTRTFRGTYHMYTDDEKFTALWSHAQALPNTGCIATAEVNFSTNYQMAYPEILHRIYRKRWLSRYWQSCGIQILVDLNVSRKAEQVNILGVPKGWTAFATRGYSAAPQELLRQAAIARHIAGDRTILFLVCGGGKKIKQLCQEKGFVFVPAFDYEQISNGYGDSLPFAAEQDA